jgi:hypothetical protein
MLIKNKTITIGNKPDLNFYRILTLAIKDCESLDGDYSLEFNIEKIKIDT